MNVEALLDFIAQPESRGNYNAIWGGIKKMHRPSRLLVQMTVGEVLDWQDSIDHLYQSEAAGKYQVLEDTLRGVYREAGLTLGAYFDKPGQDAIALALLKRRGLYDYIAARITDERFANNLAREWASLPVVSGPKAGRSHYAGDGLNKSHVQVVSFLAAVRAVKDSNPTALQTPKASPEALRPAPPKSPVMAMVGFLMAVGVVIYAWVTK